MQKKSVNKNHKLYPDHIPKFITNLVLKYKTVKGIEILGHLGFGDGILIPKHCLLPHGHFTVHERKN